MDKTVLNVYARWGEDDGIIEVDPKHFKTLTDEIKRQREWRPMETAPKDETEILGLTASGNMYVVAYEDVFSNPWRVINEFGFSEKTIVRWMPLPEPPKD